jgi:signal peptidase I
MMRSSSALVWPRSHVGKDCDRRRGTRPSPTAPDRPRVKAPLARRDSSLGHTQTRWCYRFAVRWYLIYVLAIGAVFASGAVLVGCAAAHRASIVVNGDSMAPRITSGERITVTRGRLPNRFDIVLYRYDSETNAVGRAIGLPGEQIVINGPELWVNGVKIEDPYAASPANYVRNFSLSDSQYVVLQDQRSTGGDSHTRGPISVSEIIGSAPP